jgi:hypothetical protein
MVSPKMSIELNGFAVKEIRKTVKRQEPYQGQKKCEQQHLVKANIIQLNMQYVIPRPYRNIIQP